MKFLIVDICNFVEVFSYFYVVFGISRRKQIEIPHKICLISCSIIWVAIAIIGHRWDNFSNGSFPGFLFISFAILWSLFDIAVSEMIAIGIAEWTVLLMLERMLATILYTVTSNDTIVQFGLQFILVVSIWIFYAVTKRKYNIFAFRFPIKVWIVLDSILIVLTAMVWYFSFAIVEVLPSSKTATIGQILSLTGSCVILIALFLMIYIIESAYNIKRQKDALEEQSRQQKKYFQYLLKREEETSKFRHDIKNELLQIQSYAQTNEFEKMNRFLEQTLGAIKQLGGNRYNIGNGIINTVINYYLGDLDKRYIVRVSGLLSEVSSIEERDLCIVSANLLKNAVEALLKLDSGHISVKVSEGKQYIWIKVQNSYDGKLLFDDRGMLQTRKSNKAEHGFGFQNILDIIEKYHGNYKIDKDDTLFSIEIFLEK